MLGNNFHIARVYTTVAELTKDESMSILALAEAEARFQRAQKEYCEARQDLERKSASINAKMPWLKRAVDFYDQ